MARSEYRGRRYRLSSTLYEEQGKARGKQTATRTGIGAAAGAIIGAIAAGGKQQSVPPWAAATSYLLGAESKDSVRDYPGIWSHGSSHDQPERLAKLMLCGTLRSKAA